MDRETLLKKEKEVDELLYDIHNECVSVFQPLYPWVFVRVLPREEKTDSGIILPHLTNKDMSTGKPISEAVVIKTWKSRIIRHQTRLANDEETEQLITLAITNALTALELNDHIKDTVHEAMSAALAPHVKYSLHKVFTSMFMPGDHVTYPSYGGYTVPGLHEDKYRIIAEDATSDISLGHINGVVNYTRDSVADQMCRKMFLKWNETANVEGLSVFEFCTKVVLDNFDVVSKDVETKTRSGSGKR
jgi:co-chaperonin GroES (HSP10)